MCIKKLNLTALIIKKKGKMRHLVLPLFIKKILSFNKTLYVKSKVIIVNLREFFSPFYFPGALAG